MRAQRLLGQSAGGGEHACQLGASGRGRTRGDQTECCGTDMERTDGRTQGRGRRRRGASDGDGEDEGGPNSCELFFPAVSDLPRARATLVHIVVGAGTIARVGKGVDGRAQVLQR